MKKTILMLMMVAGIGYAANEITVSTTLKVAKDALEIERKSGTKQFTMSGNRFSSYTITLTTTNQFLSKGNVVSSGWCYMRNMETNTAAIANISFDGGATTTLVLNAQEPALFRLHPSALVTNFTGAASSTNSTVNFEITVIED